MNNVKIKYVAQRGSKDCVIACLAMILPISYENIAKRFWTGNTTGVPLDAATDYLIDHGFFTVTKEARGASNLKEYNREMWKPFAPIHLIQSKEYVDKPWTHAIIMNNKGKIYDPGDLRATKNSFYEIIKVIGLFPN